jgi:methyl-accepting chemotaxis protein
MDEGTQKVDNGVKLAHEAGEALGKIVTGVQNVTDMVSHIATSTEEQSSTTDEITRTMDSISEVAKSNVQAIGEVSRATSEMARLAAELKDLVSNFRVAGQSSVTELHTARSTPPAEGETKAA